MTTVTVTREALVAALDSLAQLNYLTLATRARVVNDALGRLLEQSPDNPPDPHPGSTEEYERWVADGRPEGRDPNQGHHGFPHAGQFQPIADLVIVGIRDLVKTPPQVLHPCWVDLIDLCGHWQDGTEKVVTISQDSGLKCWLVRVGDNVYWGSSPQTAIEKAKADKTWKGEP